MSFPSRMPFQRRLDDRLVLVSTTGEHADRLERLQRIVFPTLAETQRFKAAHYRRHLELFPDGQFVVVDGDRVVASTTTLRRHFDFEAPDHTFDQIIQGGWLTSHEPGGDWLYGADVGVHPEYRRRGLARALYAVRQELVWRLGLRGQITAGMLSGYGRVKDRMTAAAYLDAVKDGRLTDPTLAAQRRVGFELRSLLPNHLDDPGCDNYAVLIVLDAGHDVSGAVRPPSGEG